MLSTAATSTAGMASTAAVATAGVAIVSWYHSNSSSLRSSQSEALGTSSSSSSVSEVPFQIEVHLLDKIKNKSYLQNAKNNIPSTLRILAVDLPEMRSSAFKNGICRLSHDKIFVDDIAPPKSVVLEELEDINTNNTINTTTITDSKQHNKKQQQKKQTMKISQKALVQVR